MTCVCAEGCEGAAVSNQIFPGLVRDAELRSGCGAVQCLSALAHAGGSEARTRARWVADSPRAPPHPFDGARRAGAADAQGSLVALGTHRRRRRAAPDWAQGSPSAGNHAQHRMKTVFPTLAAAQKRARDLKAEFPMLQIKVYDAEKKTRTLVESDKT